MSIKQEDLSGMPVQDNSSMNEYGESNGMSGMMIAGSSKSVNITNAEQLAERHDLDDISMINEQEEKFSNEHNNEDVGKHGQKIPEQPDLKVIRRKVNNYVGFANLPKQWHRKSIQKGFNLNLLVVSEKGMGKSTLVNTLFNKNIYKDENAVRSTLSTSKVNDNIEIKLEDNGENRAAAYPEESAESNNDIKIEVISTIIEENGVALKLTVVDTPGYGDAIDNTNCWEPIVKEINSRFDQYLDQENRINRSNIEDNRIHACLYLIEPTAHFLKPLDLQFCLAVHEKCNLIPIIAKSDILTDEEITSFKARILNQLTEAGVQLFRPPTYQFDDSETINLTNELYNKMPYAVVGSTNLVTNAEGKQVRGRAYPWGVIEVDNAQHNDFVYLRDLLIRQCLEELREKTDNVLYESYRSQKLIKLGIKQDNSVFKEFDPEMRQKEDKQLHEAKLAKLEAEMKSVFQNKVSEKEKKLQKSENELFARHKEMKEKLTKQLKALEEKKHSLEMSISQASQSPAQKKKGFLR
ncbi:hypothetical protein TPHA_0K02060 [Tetrapisispora phaffii CBS 4417]|uniref:Septin-type G domain-containing protein n=1 Tax=Tetrapisispora phaffii (strain ATCC 24235 / CBS 4417 / NBRC 1672 / NRRL Y-8282 / UCD 70-5) TaxID=1071381 RepID=G8BZL1_TETPH|nr:hypothetical protein TPHA_0K02060 [Tetrapisispora phaffii CBS 4417]CCE65339.1 hypothetical protein TPHA_0K02060 [Tetrapisispora phaffii CBS 4417]